MRRRVVTVALLAATAPTPTAAARPHPEAVWCPPHAAKCQRPRMTRGERRALRAWKVRQAHRGMFRYWSRQYIPACTWVGESGPGPEFAGWRYTVPNSAGSGAYGKYQMMPSTYAAWARFRDWSRADQERAAHRLYRAAGTSPWQGCG